MNGEPYGVTIFNNSASVIVNLTQILTDAQTLGLRWIRLQQNWRTIESPQGTYNWTVLDTFISQCSAVNINVCFCIQNAPTWALTTASQKATTEPYYLMDPTLTGGFAQKIAQRYNGGAHGLLGALEIGNEDFNIHHTPPNAGWLGIHNSPYAEYNGTVAVTSGVEPTRDPYFFAPCLKAASPLIRAASSQTKVGLASIWWTNSNNYTDFMAGLYANLSQASTYFDYANLHYYPAGHDPLTNNPSFPTAWGNIQAAMQAAGDTLKEIWVTEYGWTTSTNFGRPATSVVTTAQQSTYYTHLLDSARQSGVVTHAFFYGLMYNSDGMSLVQGSVPTQTYLPAFTTLQNYITTYPTWTGTTPPVGTPVNPLGRGVLAQDRFGDEYSSGLRPLWQALPLSYSLVASKYAASVGLTYTIQKANVNSLLLYYVLAPSGAFAINGDSSIIAPDQVTHVPRPVTARTLIASPVLQGYKSMTWSYAVLQQAEYSQLLSYYNPFSPVVLLTYPDENGTWQQRQAIMHPPQYGTATTVVYTNVVLTFTRLN